MNTNLLGQRMFRFFTSLWILIVTPILASLLLFFSYIFFIHLPQIYNSLLERQKIAITDKTQIVWSVLQFYHDREKLEGIPREAAQKLALQTIAQIRFGEDNKSYFWINDLRPYMVLHPYVPSLNGTDLSNYQDPNGKRLFIEMVEKSKATGSSFVSYDWQWQDDQTRIVPKVSFVKRFEPWGWVVGTGIYLVDVAEEADRQAKQLFFTSSAILALITLMAFMSIWYGGKATKKIRDSETTLRGIFEQTTDFMGMLNLNGEIQKVNKAATHFMESSEEEMVGTLFWQTGWWSHHPEEKKRIKNAVLAAQSGSFTKFELFHKETSPRSIFEFSILPITNRTGLPLFVLVNGVDITSRIKDQEKLNELNINLEERVAERTSELEESLNKLQQAQTQLVQSEKMAALGGLVAGVSHEINTPLGLGVTNATFLQEQIEKIKKSYHDGSFTKGEFETFLERAEEATRSMMLNLNRGAEIIRSFKQVAVDQEIEQKRVINVQDYMEEVLISLKPKYKHSGHSIILDSQDDLSLNTYPGILMQVFSNLIINSIIHAFREEQAGVIKIEARNIGEFIQFIYTDDGKGMNEEQAKKIYDPFYTTKLGDGGTGLGMHIVYNLIHQKLHGEITLDTSPENGVRFTILLPKEFPDDKNDPVAT